MVVKRDMGKTTVKRDVTMVTVYKFTFCLE